MKIIVEKTFEDMSRTAANMVLAKMISPYRVNLSITAGTTPKEVYKIMVPQVKGKDYLDNVYYYNFDEIPVNGQERGITIRDLYNLYFDPAGVNPDHVVELNERNYQTQMERIRQAGGLDLMLLGLGWDGHYCGNLPHTTKFEDEIVAVPTDPAMSDRIAKHHDMTAEQYPNYYITMGPKAVMETKELIVIASGKRKAEAVRELIHGPIRNDFPATLLRLHPNITLILDEEAASLL